jgi:hypothetical protein
MLSRKYKDKVQPLLSARHVFVLFSLCCFLFVLVGLNSLFLSKNSGAYAFFHGADDPQAVLPEQEEQRGAAKAAFALRVKLPGGTKVDKRLAELEKQVAVFSRLLKYEKEQRTSDKTKSNEAVAGLQQKLKKAQREVHDLSNSKPSSDAGADDVNKLPPLKIFVYDMPEFFNVKQSKLNPDCRHDYSTTWQTKYTLEVYLHEQLLKSKVRTTDPEEANLFYVPLYISCYMHARATNFFRANDHVRKSLEWVKSTHPYWNRTRGRDHVWTFTHDIGGCVAPYREMHHSIFITNTGELRDRSRAMAYYTGMYSPDYQQKKRDMTLPCFDPWKDIVAPPMINDQSLIDSQGGSAEGHHKRTILASFRGTILTGGTWEMYSRYIRQTWQKIYAGDDEIHITAVHPREGMGSREKATKYAATYREDFLNSKFCLCPPGWATWTPRLYEALLLGCVPTVVADDNVLPYSRTLDYSKFSVHISEKNADKLKPILSAAEKRIGDLRKGMKGVWPAFVYNTPDPLPGDAFYHLMWELHFRAKTLGVMNGMTLSDPWYDE